MAYSPQLRAYNIARKNIPSLPDFEYFWQTNNVKALFYAFDRLDVFNPVSAWGYQCPTEKNVYTYVHKDSRLWPEEWHILEKLGKLHPMQKFAYHAESGLYISVIGNYRYRFIRKPVSKILFEIQKV